MSDRPDNSISFLEKVATVQKLQHDLEARRVALDRQLNTRVVKLDLKMAKQKSQRLEQYYRKICEDERRANIRNEKIREDLARAETRLKWMSQRSDRFKALKDEYEKMVEREYPGWLDQLASYQKILNEKNLKMPMPSADCYRPSQPPTGLVRSSSIPNPPQFVGSLGSTMSQPTVSQNQIHASGFFPHAQQVQPSWLPQGFSGALAPAHSNQQPTFGYVSIPDGHTMQPPHVSLDVSSRYVSNEQKSSVQVPIGIQMPFVTPTFELRDRNQDPNSAGNRRRQEEEIQRDNEERLKQPQYQKQQEQPELPLACDPEKVAGRLQFDELRREKPTQPEKQLSSNRDKCESQYQRGQQRQTETEMVEEANSDVVEEYKKTLERADSGYNPFSNGQYAVGEEEDCEVGNAVEKRSPRNSQVQARKRSENDQPKAIEDNPDGFQESKMKRIISIPSANDDDVDDVDDVDDDEERDKYSEDVDRDRAVEDRRDDALEGRPSKEIDRELPRRSPQPIDSSFKPTVGGGDLAGTLDLLDSSLGSVNSESLPDLSPVRSVDVGRSRRCDGGVDSASIDGKSKVKSPGTPPPKDQLNGAAMGVKKKASDEPVIEKSSENPKIKEVGLLRRRKSNDIDEEDDDIFERVEKKDAKVKEEANVAYQRMMSTMKSESSTSRAVNTNKALDSSSEDELENAIQRAVLGNKAKKEIHSPPAKSISPRSPTGASLGSKSQSSPSGSPVRTASQSHSATSAPKKPPSQTTQQKPTTKFQPKKPTTNFGMFSASAASSSGGRPAHLRQAGSDSDLDDISSDAGRRKSTGKRSAGASKHSDDDFDFYG